jgi:2'-5' RNA ligase
MRATFALLTNRHIENQINWLAWQINLRFQTGVQPRCLAAHVSLKQPFDIGDNLDTLERYMADFAATVPPVDIELADFFVWETVFAVDVRETTTLRTLHNRLNQKLPPLFGDVSAEHDGEEYHFHLTVATGGATPEIYQAIYETYTQIPIATTFTANELAMFVYHEQPSGRRDYMTHTVLPLTGS